MDIESKENLGDNAVHGRTHIIPTLFFVTATTIIIRYPLMNTEVFLWSPFGLSFGKSIIEVYAVLRSFLSSSDFNIYFESGELTWPCLGFL